MKQATGHWKFGGPKFHFSPALKSRYTPMSNAQADVDRLEETVARIIEARGGDMRKGLKSLILANEHPETELKAICAKISTGFMRESVSRHNCSGVDW